ncbi:MAG: aminoacyl-tRNA hydrolase [Clostridia bacterium]|nr:aminoacyl-tRNA hydrolase [Clostridia bacterium]
MSNIFDLFKKIETPSAGPITYVVAGLGNPGAQYEHTRHNVGFAAIDDIAAAAGVRIDRARFHGLTGECTLGGIRMLLLKPTTFMNLSGEAVAAALNFYKLTPDRLIVLCDDISFDPGKLRIRRRGSHGGHNGLRNIIDHLGTEDFCRLKIGVGKKPSPDYDLVDWVLGNLPKSDREAIAARFTDIREAVTLCAKGEIDAAMNAYSK